MVVKRLLQVEGVFSISYLVHNPQPQSILSSLALSLATIIVRRWFLNDQSSFMIK